MRKNTLFPISKEVLQKVVKDAGINRLGGSPIIDVIKVVNALEQNTGIEFIRMEMGMPGIQPSKIAVQAEICALKNGKASVYPPVEGIPGLKTEISKFFKNFLNINISEKSCVPTVGIMQGSLASFLVSCRRNNIDQSTLFIDPGFPVQKTQHKVLGLKSINFDIYNYRGHKLYGKLKSVLDEEDVSTMIYSNPNNPTWTCLSEEELGIIGRLADEYDVIVVEDLAYVGMDFRKDYSKPGQPPFQPTVAQYTDNYILLISSSKAFSYAGQRIAAMGIADKLYNREFKGLLDYFNTAVFGEAIIYGALFALSTGTSHSAQYALEAILKASNQGILNYLDDVKEYAYRAASLKRIFLKAGFNLVYDKDEMGDIADGFYFTVAYKGMDGKDLLEKLIAYGISCITMDIAGSDKHEGLRIAASMVLPEQMKTLEERLELFTRNF